MSADLSFPTLPRLDPEDHAALKAACSRRTLGRGEMLDAETVLFPAQGVVRTAASSTYSDGVLATLVAAGEAAGLTSALGDRPTGQTAVALTEVVGFAIEGERLRRMAAERSGLALALAGLLARESAQVQDELACGAHHRIEQRLARLLLRLPEGDPAGVSVTQDELAEMLAVQRTTVTMLAMRLKTGKLIEYRRGRLRILDRDGLARLACGCPLD